MNNRAPISLRLRLVCLVLGCEILVMVLAGTILFRHLTSQLVASFDGGLQSNAEALASLLEFDDELGELELEFSDEVMARFSKPSSPDLFVVYDADGEVIEASRAITGRPPWAKASTEAQTRDFLHGGVRYRGMVLPAAVEIEEDSDEGSIPVTVFFASSRADLDRRLADSEIYTATLALVALLLSAAGVWWATGRGLTPIAQLAEKARSIGEADLDHRFRLASFPPELQPLARDFNGLLARLEEAFERERRFSADAAHELRTPVASLKAGIQSAQLRVDSDEVGNEVLEDLLAETERLESLCQSLLDLAATDRPPEDESGMDARDIESAVHSIADEIAEKSHREVLVVARVEDDAPAAATSPTTVRRILMNLLENALTHGGTVAEVTVTLVLTRNELSLSVADTGPGIPPDAVPRLFERFFRADKHRARSAGGAGLGLAICRALARSEGGDLVHAPLNDKGCRMLWTMARKPQGDGV
jgi:signal transduction histidine kinase